MAYRFTKDEMVPDGIRRIAEERLERSLKRLKNKKEQLEAVHDVRKDIKKLRALLRLVRHEVGDKVYRRDVAALRDAAHRLAPARDAKVKLDTFNQLVEHFQEQLAAKPFPTLRQRLENHFQTENKHFESNEAADGVIQVFEKLYGRAVDWQPDAKDWAAIAPGLERSYRGGRAALLLAQKDRHAETFHEWRKRAKDLWYHIRLLCPAWPAILGALSDQLKELSDCLGDHHDLAVLRDAVNAETTAKSQNEV
ncbi:MAG: CHAD domain-containing protein, partial [Limisphaerales bacterium]